MDATEFQKISARTLNETLEPKDQLTNYILGVFGEFGEVVEHVKKGVFHKHGMIFDRRCAIADEIGDMCWYIAAICTTLDLRLGDILQQNVEKLQKRYPNGFNIEDSKHE